MGNIGQSQNLFLLVDSVRRIEKFKYNKFEFNLVGSGRMQENLRKYIHEKKLQSIIKLYKFKKLKELKNIINSSDVLYLSLIEGKFIGNTFYPKNNKEIKEVNHIDVIANKGVVGDRHFSEFNDPYNQLSLIESENIDQYK